MYVHNIYVLIIVVHTQHATYTYIHIYMHAYIRMCITHNTYIIMYIHGYICICIRTIYMHINSVQTDVDKVKVTKQG